MEQLLKINIFHQDVFLIEHIFCGFMNAVHQIKIMTFIGTFSKRLILKRLDVRSIFS